MWLAQLLQQLHAVNKVRWLRILPKYFGTRLLATVGYSLAFYFTVWKMWAWVSNVMNFPWYYLCIRRHSAAPVSKLIGLVFQVNVNVFKEWSLDSKYIKYIVHLSGVRFTVQILGYMQQRSRSYIQFPPINYQQTSKRAWRWEQRQ